MSTHRIWLPFCALIAMTVAVGILLSPRLASAQSPSSLGNDDLLSLVLPPGPDGNRPPVHMWARADQAQGPGGYPTVFVVTLLTVQGASGPEEHEVVNYVQYTSGGWAPARPRGTGTLLLDDWAWISLNLTNLTAAVSGTGNNSTYTVDYTASGPSGSGTRQIAVEEVYGADLSLQSSTVLSDTNPSSGASSTGAAPSATAAPVLPTVRPSTSTTPAAGTPAASPGSNVIRSVSPTPTASP